MSEAIAYYPGCSGLGTSREYDASTRAVCAAVGLSLVDIPDWSCCGSSPAHTKDHVLSAALSARNLQLVADMGLRSAITPCPSCLTNLRTANHRMETPATAEKVNKLLDVPYGGQVNTQSVLQALVETVGLDALKAAVRTPLKGLKVACYYGCIMNRPPELMAFDDCENPMAMDNILSAMGAEVVPFPLKVECCGASYGIPRPDVVATLSGKLLETAKLAGADMIAVACPLCQMNLDLRQGQVNRAQGTSYKIPVPYFTQLMGVALNVSDEELGFGQLCVDPRPVLSKALAGAD
ncbi:CoB--CoM heterodisulfide reductase [Solidesulfovibrio carbinoliphilus subsp. oakridgensis]|uniref:CoB--CoM heterodisulfide reductase n=1 Tax=Solidesulfovibrio carbinoliphilus subsp. oakridgensis TaxID=694327 RepID=G7Q9K0_9BACT|nr:CoB--CoM heterodisulfide reductase iron-sulfur subunit B family protein [Solidesulfovibrio carbinoliphilus]EHJ48640.1 CoB--CoM heterodisulfide reductase [Solidesulfovibrio carbinoliphilus subsp. oakridgensis]